MTWRIAESTGFQNGGFRLMAYGLAPDRQPMKPTQIQSISYKVFDLSDTADPPTPTAEGTLDPVSNHIFDPPITGDPGWPYESPGYNFAWDVPAAISANGDRKYRYEFNFQPAPGEGEPFRVAHERNITKLLGG